MPAFATFIPCLSGKATRKIHEDATEPDSDTGNEETKVGDIIHPTSGEYAKQAAKEFLNVLETVAQAIPVPGLAMAVKIASNLMKTCEDSDAVLERAQDLKLRIKTIVVTLVNELKGKKADEIQAKVVDDINTLKQLARLP
ncbi:hypothetical protein H0H87_010141 [Tephrocybe sp. NHM501043]|nr:hypothetical protein H0H87_010141 [Tephrocybe sp. NHM501043]